jgi:SAM-dependent methyltransferase
LRNDPIPRAPVRAIVPIAGFEWAYRNGIPPWDIGRPQPGIVRLAEQGLIAGAVIDLGCGTGENALYLGSRGLTVVGVDAAPTAIARAQEKARERGTDATFIEADALDLEALGRTFDVAIDCGLFHTFSDSDRIRFVRSLHRTLRVGGRYILLCFSERQPGEWGPRRVTQAEIRAMFASGWRVDSIVAGIVRGPAARRWSGGLAGPAHAGLSPGRRSAAQPGRHPKCHGASLTSALRCCYTCSTPELLVGPVYFRLMFGGEPTPRFAERIVDTVLRGFAPRPR